jgi:hypothetical protein
VAFVSIFEYLIKGTLINEDSRLYIEFYFDWDKVRTLLTPALVGEFAEPKPGNIEPIR